MKILWLSNKLLSSEDCGRSGAWLDTIAEMLISSGHVELGNISFGPGKEVSRQDYGPIRQWAVPDNWPLHGGIPSSRHVSEILTAVRSFAPDLVHVWGTESFWGLLTARKIIPQPSLLEIQGLRLAIAPVFSGGLTFGEQLACTGLKEIVRGTTIFHIRKTHERWRKMEEEIISGHQYIATPSDWSLAHIKNINRTCKTFTNYRILRRPFYRAAPYMYTSKPAVFCIAAYTAPFKGLHVAIRAIGLLKTFFPGIELRVAGSHQSGRIAKDGYISWINREIDRMGIRSNVIWLGSIPASQIVNEIHKCTAMVMPSFIENDSLAFSEAMMVGIPIVASFTGGMAHLGSDEQTALFFAPGDAVMCAHQLERIINDKILAARLSRKEREVAFARHDPEKILTNQLKIYRDIVSGSELKTVLPPVTTAAR
jgi:glycosyltransferase involved in cell wall biosynthesis